MRKIKEFISDMKKELDRIRWCKGKELLKNVIITLVFIVFFALFFAVFFEEFFELLSALL